MPRNCGLCQPISRRSLLRSGLTATLGAIFSTRLGAAAQALAKPAGKSVIVLYMGGGPSQLDTFDPKPGTANGGPFKGIATRIPGVQFSEHLPRLAERANQLAVVRTMTSREGSHARARYLVHTAYLPTPSVQHASLGSTFSHELGDPAFDLPSYVCLGGAGEGAGFFGPDHAPFEVRSAPGAPIENLRAPNDVDDRRLASRFSLARLFDRHFSEVGGEPESTANQAMLTKARRMMQSPLVRAFELESESPDVKARYGTSQIGLRCLTARRLVETGVRCVEIEMGGWDTHKDNFTAVGKLAGELDPAVSALLDDLAARDLLHNTLVLWIGEFGRSPKINNQDGRDHHPACFSAVLAGGGVKGGVAVGSTSPDGLTVATRPVSVMDLYATVLKLAGIDPTRVFYSNSRPIALGNNGKLISEVLG